MTHIVVDLDGTLCNDAHRVHLKRAGMFAEYDELLRGDIVNEAVLWLLNHGLTGQVKVCLVTGRGEALRPDTMAWLIEKRIFWDELLMRARGDFAPEHELKPRLLENRFGSVAEAKFQTGFVLDDSDKCVEAWRNFGLTCWQVGSGE